MRRRLAALCRALALLLEPLPKPGTLNIGEKWYIGPDGDFCRGDVLAILGPSPEWGGSLWAVSESAADRSPSGQGIDAPSGDTFTITQDMLSPKPREPASEMPKQSDSEVPGRDGSGD